jgi:hypothetical protein
MPRPPRRPHDGGPAAAIATATIKGVGRVTPEVAARGRLMRAMLRALAALAYGWH